MPPLLSSIAAATARAYGFAAASFPTETTVEYLVIAGGGGGGGFMLAVAVLVDTVLNYTLLLVPCSGWH
jgi:hypothetical protein